VLKRLIWALLALPAALVLVSLAIANRQKVQLILDPFRPEAPALSLPHMPLYALLLGTLILGVVLGGMATWMTQSRWRRTARSKSQDAMRWQAEADRLARERDQRVEGEKRLALSGR
jgi:Lipopolysaccharide assembly protein A domain